jgi:hypothetical protein
MDTTTKIQMTDAFTSEKSGLRIVGGVDARLEALPRPSQRLVDARLVEQHKHIAFRRLAQARIALQVGGAALDRMRRGGMLFAPLFEVRPTRRFEETLASGLEIHDEKFLRAIVEGDSESMSGGFRVKRMAMVERDDMDVAGDGFVGAARRDVNEIDRIRFPVAVEIADDEGRLGAGYGFNPRAEEFGDIGGLREAGRNPDDRNPRQCDRAKSAHTDERPRAIRHPQYLHDVGFPIALTNGNLHPYAAFFNLLAPPREADARPGS